MVAPVWRQFRVTVLRLRAVCCRFQGQLNAAHDFARAAVALGDSLRMSSGDTSLLAKALDELTLVEAEFEQLRAALTCVVLAGSETAHAEPDRHGNDVGLANAALICGARCVVASLWPVGGLGTALLMDRFHKSRAAGIGEVQALHSAKNWLRIDIASGEHLADSVWPAIRAGLPPFLQDRGNEAAYVIARRSPRTAPFANAFAWAAFGVFGTGW